MTFLVPKNQSNYWPKVFNDSFFNDFFRPSRELSRVFSDSSAFHAPVDITENGNGYLLKMDIPGVAKEDILISCDKGVLTISGKRESEKVEEEGSSYKKERFSGSFKRRFTLGDGVDPEDIKAKLEDGVLEVALSKRPEAELKQIPIT